MEASQIPATLVRDDGSRIDVEFTVLATPLPDHIDAGVLRFPVIAVDVAAGRQLRQNEVISTEWIQIT